MRGPEASTALGAVHGQVQAVGTRDDEANALEALLADVVLPVPLPLPRWPAPSNSTASPASTSSRSGAPRKRPSRSKTGTLTGGSGRPSSSTNRRSRVSHGLRTPVLAERRRLPCLASAATAPARTEVGLEDRLAYEARPDQDVEHDDGFGEVVGLPREVLGDSWASCDPKAVMRENLRSLEGRAHAACSGHVPLARTGREHQPYGLPQPGEGIAAVQRVRTSTYAAAQPLTRASGTIVAASTMRWATVSAISAGTCHPWVTWRHRLPARVRGDNPAASRSVRERGGKVRPSSRANAPMR